MNVARALIFFSSLLLGISSFAGQNSDPAGKPKTVTATFVHLEFKNKVVNQNGFIYGWTSDKDGIREAELVFVLDHRKDPQPIYAQEVVLRVPVVVDMEDSAGITVINYAEYEEDVGFIKRLDGKKLGAVLGDYYAAIKLAVGFKKGAEGIAAINGNGVVALLGLTMGQQPKALKGEALDLGWQHLKILQTKQNDGIDWNQVIKIN